MLVALDMEGLQAGEVGGFDDVDLDSRDEHPSSIGVGVGPEHRSD